MFISAADAAAVVERALQIGDEVTAIRHLTEAVSRLIRASPDHGIPRSVLGAPAPVKDVRYRTLIATAFAYALLMRGAGPLPWMTAPVPLSAEWLWGSEGASEPYRDLVRRDTPQIFRAKNILTRARDWVTF